MKIAGIKIRYILLLWALVVLMLGSVLYFGYARNMDDLSRLMENEVLRIAEIVTVSTAAGIDSYEDIEVMTAFRLLDNARLLARIVARSPLSEDECGKIAAENELNALELYDSAGTMIVGIDTVRNETDKSKAAYRTVVNDILNGSTGGEFVGFDTVKYPAGTCLGVAMACDNGGVVVVKADYESVLGRRQSPGLGTLGRLFRGLSSETGIQYIAVQDTLGIVVASPEIGSMTRIQHDPFLKAAWNGGTATRSFTDGDHEIFELVRPFVMNGRQYGLLRIGLGTEAVHDIRSNTVRHFGILFAVSLISGAFLLLYVVLKQNYTLLNMEHDRILAEVKLMEEERQRTERLASLGHLAAGVAHEIRNPLNGISMIIQQLTREIGSPGNEDDHREMLAVMGEESKRIGTIIEHFLSYARPPDLSLSTVAATQIVETVAEAAERLGDGDIKVDYSCEPELVCVCDAEQLRRALDNIVVNAIDACNGQGMVSISVKEENNWIVFTIRDSGPGLKKEVLPRVFDPYFTTKDNGTGLGLAEAHRIAVAHGGRITVINGDDGGAVFSISLPMERK